MGGVRHTFRTEAAVPVDDAPSPSGVQCINSIFANGFDFSVLAPLPLLTISTVSCAASGPVRCSTDAKPAPPRADMKSPCPPRMGDGTLSPLLDGKLTEWMPGCSSKSR